MAKKRKTGDIGGKKSEFETFLKYSLVGAGVGLGAGLLFKRKIFLFALGGFVLGGYFGTTAIKMNRNIKDRSKDLKNYSKT